MACSKLSEINSDSDQWTICVLVSRLWHFRGGTDEGPIKHTDLVLLDSEGTHMYGQIPSIKGTADRLKGLLEEGKVYVIKKFFCNEYGSRPNYRPVESPFMVQFTRFTTIEARPGVEESFPFCTYSLTAFADIPRPTTYPDRFIDVIGKITMVSDVMAVQSMYQTTASNTRTVVLNDLLGNELKIILWGDRAVQFDGEAVRVMGGKEPVIGIFVGLVPKMARGVKILSGSAACRWYVDEDIPDINSFRESIRGQFIPLAPYVPTGPDALRSRAQEQPTDKTVKELADLDPFVDMDKRFFCTVTVDRLGLDQRWWFPSCTTCRKSSKHNGFQYKCSDDSCSSVDADPTYCISMFASDGTAETEFVMFDKVATGAVGKPLLAILRQKYPGCATVDEMASLARHDVDIPAQITHLVGQRYKLMVSISKKWKLKNGEDLSFQVNRIDETYKPELPPSVDAVSSGSAKNMSVTSVCGEKLPVLGPLILPGSATPSPINSALRSPAAQKHTPASAGKTAPSTPSPGPVAPKRGTRRSLFGKSPKGKPDAVLEDGASSAQAAVEANDSHTSKTVEMKDTDAVLLEPEKSMVAEKDAEALPPKSKRPPSGAKVSGTAKKQK